MYVCINACLGCQKIVFVSLVHITHSRKPIEMQNKLFYVYFLKCLQFLCITLIYIYYIIVASSAVLQNLNVATTYAHKHIYIYK